LDETVFDLKNKKNILIKKLNIFISLFGIRITTKIAVIKITNKSKKVKAATIMRIPIIFSLLSSENIFFLKMIYLGFFRK
jgi:hypothetical protein